MRFEVPEAKQNIGLARIGLAVLIALVFDVADYFGAFVPVLGEAADAIPALVNSILLWNPLPMLGLIEGFSAFPPLLILDFIPFHMGILAYALYRMRKEGKI